MGNKISRRCSLEAWSRGSRSAHYPKLPPDSAQGAEHNVLANQPWGGMPGNVALEVKEVWSLSPEGKVLTITTSRNTRRHRPVTGRFTTRSRWRSPCRFCNGGFM